MKILYKYNQFVNENNFDLLSQFKNANNDLYDKLILNKKGLSADGLTNSEYVKKRMLIDQGSPDDVKYWVEEFFAKEKNFKPSTYYHVNTKNEEPYAGVGNGLYLGRDKEALLNFYDIEQQGFTVSEYKGNPNWLDLTNYDDFNGFKNMVKNIDGNIINSDIVSGIVIQMGYDGIRYYDHNATGEEFVLFNEDKLKKL